MALGFVQGKPGIDPSNMLFDWLYEWGMYFYKSFSALSEGFGVDIRQAYELILLRTIWHLL